MRRHLIRRLVLILPSLLGIATVLYAVLALAPGDPLAEAAASPDLTPEVRMHMRAALALDDALASRFAHWLGAMLRGDWGTSFVSHLSVSALIRDRIGVTLAIVGASQVFALLIALSVGTLSAIRPYSWFDRIASVVALAGFSLPTFFTGTLLILVFSIKLHWLPMVYRSDLEAQGWGSVVDSLRQAIMPVTVLSIFQGAGWVRYVRSTVLDVVRLDYVTTARSKGLPEHKVMIRHVLRNAAPVLLTLVMVQMPAVFGGAIVTEQIFRIPGIGSLLIMAIMRNDMPVIMGVTFIFAILVLASNLIADLLHGALDPRVASL